MIGAIYSGDDRVLDLSFVDTAGDAFDLTGYSITVKLDLGVNGVVTKTHPSGVTLNPQTGATLGTAYVTFSDTETGVVEELVNARLTVRIESQEGITSTPIDDILIIKPAP
jgi:hypothetical protein